jgi:hypothetical protein
VVSLESDPEAAIRALAPDGVDRIVEVAMSANADLDAAVIRNGAVLAAYSSPDDQPELPFSPMLFANLTIRLLGSDDFPQEAKNAAARDLTAAAAHSALTIPVAEMLSLPQIASAHELVESGTAAGSWCRCRDIARPVHSPSSVSIRRQRHPIRVTHPWISPTTFAGHHGMTVLPKCAVACGRGDDSQQLVRVAPGAVVGPAQVDGPLRRCRRHEGPC